MNAITSEDLALQADAILSRVEAGEEFEVSRDGRPIARLSRSDGRRRFVPVAEFMELFGNDPLDAEAFWRDVKEGIDHSIRDPYDT